MKIDLNTKDYDMLFQTADTYRKKAKVIVRVAEADEVVKTVVNGVQETVNTAQKGDFIVTNPDGEEYIISKENFVSKYEPTSEVGIYAPKGKVKAIDNNTCDDVVIDAPWGERMVGHKNCVFVAVLDEGGEITADRYLIERQAFEHTYEISRE